MGQMNPKILVGFLGTLLKGAVLSKGGDLVLDAEVLKKAEKEFDLGIADKGDKFVITVKPASPKKAPTISLPSTPKIWTPPGT